MAPWKSDSLNISIGYSRISKDYITTCARRAHSKLAKIAHARTAFDLAVHTERTRNGDRRKTEIGKLAAELRGLTFFDDLPEIRCQLTIVTGKHLIQVPLGPDRRLQSPLFTLGGFGFVLLCFRFKISHDGATPRNTRTTFDSTLACVEKKATPREILAAYADPPGASSATLGLPQQANVNFHADVRFWVRASRPRPQISRNDSRIWPVRVQPYRSRACDPTADPRARAPNRTPWSIRACRARC